MDNHRAALWCWLREISPNQKYNLYHIDAHYDCRTVKGTEWLSRFPDLASMEFADYLEFQGNDPVLGSYPAIIWDNYLALFLERYGAQVEKLLTSTHEITTPPVVPYEEVKPYNFAQFFRDCVVDTETPEKWIINIDLDYFFSRQPNEFKEMFSETYVDEIFGALGDGQRAGRFVAVTISLSPECTGGWKSAEKLCERLCEKLDITFSLAQM